MLRSKLHCPVNLALHATEEQYARFTSLRCVHLWGTAIGLSSVLERLPMSVEGEFLQICTCQLQVAHLLILLEMTLPFDHANDHTSILTSTSRFENLTFLRVMQSRFEVPPACEDVVCADAPPHHYIYSVCFPLMHIRSDSSTDIVNRVLLQNYCSR